jgi:hypothetical protein
MKSSSLLEAWNKIGKPLKSNVLVFKDSFNGITGAIN